MAIAGVFAEADKIMPRERERESTSSWVQTEYFVSCEPNWGLAHVRFSSQDELTLSVLSRAWRWPAEVTEFGHWEPHSRNRLSEPPPPKGPENWCRVKIVENCLDIFDDF